MNDAELEDLLNKILQDRDLIFDIEFYCEEMTGFWNDGYCCWDTKMPADPLTHLLIEKHPVLSKTTDDNFAVGSLARYLDRSPNWIRSFLDGWSGRANQHTSISAYLLGKKVRKNLTSLLDKDIPND